MLHLKLRFTVSPSWTRNLDGNALVDVCGDVIDNTIFTVSMFAIRQHKTIGKLVCLKANLTFLVVSCLFIIS